MASSVLTQSVALLDERWKRGVEVPRAPFLDTTLRLKQLRQRACDAKPFEANKMVGLASTGGLELVQTGPFLTPEICKSLCEEQPSVLQAELSWPDGVSKEHPPTQHEVEASSERAADVPR